MTRRSRAVPHPSVTLPPSIHTDAINSQPKLTNTESKTFLRPTTMSVISVIYAQVLLSIADVSAQLFSPPPELIVQTTCNEQNTENIV